jgi:hypothetical protein
LERVERLEQIFGVPPTSDVLMKRIAELERQCAMAGAGGMQQRLAVLETAAS